MTTVHSGVWTPGDRAESVYRYLPVTVPPGAAGLRVRLSHDTSAGVLDLGCVGPDGFRGWSGGARDSYVIGGSQATPGYLPGALEPGEWHVMLGLHRVPGDLPYTVEAEVLARAPEFRAPERPPTPERRPRRVLPAPPGTRWLAGDFHAHTVHSDGALTVDELAVRAAEAGLDFLAVTDHNTTSHHPHLAAASVHSGVLLLPGQEVTTERGHANAFGDIGWVDFREPAARWASTVDGRGGLMSVNHPVSADCAWRQPLPVRPPLAEIWHTDWFDRTWTWPLAWWLAWGTETIPIGGSDFHRPGDRARLGDPTTWVCVPSDVEPTVDVVLGSVRAGRTAIGAFPAGPVLLRVEDELVAVDADGAILCDFEGNRRIVRGDLARFPAGEGPRWLKDSRTRVLALCR